MSTFKVMTGLDSALYVVFDIPGYAWELANEADLSIYCFDGYENALLASDLITFLTERNTVAKEMADALNFTRIMLSLIENGKARPVCLSALEVKNAMDSAVVALSSWNAPWETNTTIIPAQATKNLVYQLLYTYTIAKTVAKALSECVNLIERTGRMADTPSVWSFSDRDAARQDGEMALRAWYKPTRAAA
jgi:hypothetical protein